MYTLTRTLRNWLNEGDSERATIRALVPLDYTMKIACEKSNGVVGEFLHLVMRLAQKRALFFRRSSPLRYMMEVAMEIVQKWQESHGANGNASKRGVVRKLRTVFRKTSEYQDIRDVQERKRKIEEEHARRRSKRVRYLNDRRRVSELKRKIRATERRLRNLESISRASLRFTDSKRDWSDAQRRALMDRIRGITCEQRFSKLKAVLEFYIPGSVSGDSLFLRDCDPSYWTIQTCRHISHVIR